MNPNDQTLFIVCVSGCVAIVVADWLRNRGNLRAALGLFAIGIYSWLVWRWLPAEMHPSGENENLQASVLFFWMVLGIAAKHFYDRFDVPPEDRPPFDWGGFLRPFFAAPLVFMPLLVVMQNADIDLSGMSLAKIMLFAVAFENGFLWKGSLDQRAKKSAEQRIEATQPKSNTPAES